MAKTNLKVAPKTKSLEALEAEIAELCERFFEDWFQIGARLILIRDGRKFTQAIDPNTGEAYASWNIYAESGRLPRMLSRSQANRLAAAAEVRPLLPLAHGMREHVWTERSVVPFTKIRHPKTKELLPRRIEQVCKKVFAAAERESRQNEKDGKPPVTITAAYVTKFVNDEIGRTAEIVAAAPTLSQEVKKERNHVASLLRGYEQIPLSEWDKVDETLLKRFAKDLRDLAKFLEA